MTIPATAPAATAGPPSRAPVRVGLGLAILGISLLVAARWASAEAEAPADGRSRAEEVTQAVHEQVEALAALDRRLRSALEQSAPELLALLDPRPPEAPRSGYQLLPDLLPRAIRSQAAPRTAKAVARSFSWPRTERIAELLRQRRATFESLLGEALAAEAGEQVNWRDVVDLYLQARPLAHLAGAHLRYNQFWQPVIAADRPRFDRLTRLHDMVLERQDLREALRGDDPAVLEIAAKWLDLPPGLANEALRQRLQERERQIGREVNAAGEALLPPGTISVRRRPGGVLLLRLEVQTDITDSRFLRRLRKEIEAAWRAEDAETRFRLRLVVRRLPPKRLYGSEDTPRLGDPIDLDAHLALFPPGLPVITTGAPFTHAIPGRHLVFGPGPLAPHDLAHEAGHLLGFRDGYFRAYRDLGADGFEILEIDPDPEDLMSSPGEGRVLASHFGRVLAALDQQPSPHPHERLESPSRDRRR